MIESFQKGGSQSMDNTVKLPVGIDDFEKLRTEGFYYIDRTGLIDNGAAA